MGMSRADVIGLGKSGMAAVKALHRRGWQVTVFDRAETPALRQAGSHLTDLGVRVHLGVDYSPRATADLVVVSPGVPWNHPGLRAARAQGSEVIGEVQLAWRWLAPCPWIAVTGTNGKTTTTALVGRIFTEAGLYAPVCGNIGYPVSELLSGPPPDWVIAELSSFQIESAQALSPRIAVWTTFSPDHLNRHGTLEAYAEIKAGLLRRSHQSILNGDDAYLHQHLQDWPEAVWTSLHEPAPVRVHAGQIVIEDEPLIEVAAVRLPGRHNLQNVLMAVAATWKAGIAPTAIAAGVRAFTGVPHRLEVVAEQQNIVFINDSKATNYDAALMGLEATEGPVVLICGGQSKQGDPEAWLRAIEERCSSVMLIGEAAGLFASWLAQRGYTPFVECGDIEHAVKLAWQAAQQAQARSVLFSPACASYDQFSNFEERGDCFRQLVHELLN